ncbi:MAG TPA: hypothetical protein VGK99_18180 [Acidobacteriota bacterium]|jgi:hypothetical protein
MKAKILFLALMLVAVPSAARAQDDPDMDRKRVMPNYYGSTGFFDLFDPDTLRTLDYVGGPQFHQYHRDPLDLRVRHLMLGAAFGLMDRLEFFISWYAATEVKRRNLSAPIFTQGVELAPFDQYNRLSQDPFPPPPFDYYPSFAFLAHKTGRDNSDGFTGLKYNLLSERRGDPLGLAVIGQMKFNTEREMRVLFRGTRSGTTDGGVKFAASKKIGRLKLLTSHGVIFTGDAIYPFGRQFPIPNEWQSAVGATYNLSEKLKVTGEFYSLTFWGSRIPSIHEVNPRDLSIGVQYFPWDSLGFTAGYRRYLNPLYDESSHNGIVFGFHVRKVFRFLARD